MSESCSFTGIITQQAVCACALVVTLSLLPAAVDAQTTSGVTVNLGVLDDVDPMATVPRLLMPSTRSAGGRVVLTPPPGVDPIKPQRSRVVLRPPPGAPARVASAPTIAVPRPAAAAAAPPTSVTSAPPPAPAPEPPPPAPAPTVAVVEEPIAAPSPPARVSADPMPMPAPAASRAPASEPDAIKETSEQVAALPASEDPIQEDGPLSIVFGVEETDLPATASTPLSELSDLLKGDDTLRVQLMAYANSADSSPSSVRRKSLSRALSVREFLMDQGVQSTRIEVRALGDKNEGGEPNRVDAVVEKR